MTKHRQKQLSAKQTLLEKLEARTLQQISDHGLITAEMCDDIREKEKEKEEKRRAKLKGKR